MQTIKYRLCQCMCAFFFMISMPQNSLAQTPLKLYTIRNGNMYIELSKYIKEASLDSFITQHNLEDLELKQFFKNNSSNSLLKAGWKIERNNQQSFVITKPIVAFDNINNPADKIIFTEKHPTLAEMFPSVNNGVTYGFNQFRNKTPFAVKEMMVTFFLQNNLRAKRVILSGSFNNWSPDALPMQKTDSGWIINVKLTPGKYWYKFILDGNWSIDKNNLLSENDGLGNLNSVYYKPNFVFKLSSFVNARRVYLSGSFNDWRTKELQMIKSLSGWQLPVYLAEGTHTYKFLVDGKWYAERGKIDRLPDGHGAYNSVIRIGKPYMFKLNGYTSAGEVILSGSFNKWRSDELYMKKTAAGWDLPYTLGPGNYEYKYRVDEKWITDPSNPFTANNGENTKNSYLIIEPNYTFKLKGFGSAKTVFLAGDFNNWSPNTLAMKKENGGWTTRAHLSVGKHLYKFVVDGEWIRDPYNKLWEENEYATGNSIIWIDK